MLPLHSFASSKAPSADQIFILSAHTEAELKTLATDLAQYLQYHEQIPLADVSYTLQATSQELSMRRVVIGSDRVALVKELAREGEKGQCAYSHQSLVAFLFAGVGEQFVGMTQEIYSCEPFFRAIVDQCCEFLLPFLPVDLRSLLYPIVPASLQASQTDALSKQGAKALVGSPESRLLQQTELAQPLMFVIEYALARLLMYWGIMPQALLGYSLGEYVAACVAGVFSLEDALRLVARRASLIGQQPAGVMLAVLCSAQQVAPFLGGQMQVELAITNSPVQCVLAGSEEAIRKIEIRLREAEIVSLRLRTEQAFHSSLLRRGQKALQKEVKESVRQHPTIPYLSNVTGTWISQQEIEDDDYWGRHMCGTARFAEGVEELVTAGYRTLIEIGPGSSLGSLVKQWELVQPSNTSEKNPLLMLSTLKRAGKKGNDYDVLLEGIGNYWQAGGRVNWEAFRGEKAGKCSALPFLP